MAANLFQYYQQRGEKLPAVSERAKIFEQRGLGTAGNYRGTTNQNIALLASFQQETPTGNIAGKLKTGAAPSSKAGPTSVSGGFGNFRVALKAALNEAAQARSAARIQQVYPDLGGVPGTMGDIARMIRGSIAPPVEDVFTTIIEEQSEQRKQSMDLLETLARDGTLGILPDSTLVNLGRNAGLQEGIVVAWKSRIAAAVEQSDRMGELEILKIQSEIDENRAQTAKALRGVSEDSLAPTEVTLAYVDQVLNDVDFNVINVPDKAERDRVSVYIYRNKIENEATNIDLVVDKLRALETTGRTAELTDVELRLWFMNDKDTEGLDYETSFKGIKDMSINNKKRARLIAGEIYGKFQYLLPLGEEVGAFIPELEGLEVPSKGGPSFAPGDYILTPPNFNSFPSIFSL